MFWGSAKDQRIAAPSAVHINSASSGDLKLPESKDAKSIASKYENFFARVDDGAVLLNIREGMILGSLTILATIAKHPRPKQ